MEIVNNVFSSVLKCTENVVGTFFTYSVFSFPESIDFLSCVIVSGWMSCCLTRGRDVKNLFSAGPFKCAYAVGYEHLL